MFKSFNTPLKSWKALLMDGSITTCSIKNAIIMIFFEVLTFRLSIYCGSSAWKCETMSNVRNTFTDFTTEEEYG